ncbi:MAG: hypothetical protein MI802_07320 [Desulfobacterales bacterium]|nr:hypothetical protein [Desulfobacterales bacterium]
MFPFLSSVRLTFYTLIALVVILSIGVCLGYLNKPALDLMNHHPLVDWTVLAAHRDPLVLAWFGLLCLASAILLINGIFCCAGRQFTLARHPGSMKHKLFFVIHLVFILVLTCHGLLLVIGSKESRISLSRGDSHRFGPYRIEAAGVTFADDPGLLALPYREQRKMMTRENFSLIRNYARIRLYHGETLVADSRVHILAPLCHKGLRVTLVEFAQGRPDQSPSIVLTLTDSPLNMIFFIVYALMILTLAGFTALTWKAT